MPARTPLGGLLQVRRRALGLSLRSVAREAGISPSYLLALEHGHNPTTGRAPTPSPRIITALGRVLGVEGSTLLDLASSPPPASPHLLLYQTGSTQLSAAHAARLLFVDRVDGWVEIEDRGRPGDGSAANDVLLRAQGPLGIVGDERRSYDAENALSGLERLLGDAREFAGTARLGLVFGASSKNLRAISNPDALLSSEATWERDVAGVCRRTLGVEPVANVCVYREPDLHDPTVELNPLTSALALVQTHPHVAVQNVDGSVTTGPAAIETILGTARPAEMSPDTWRTLASAAAVGLARRSRAASPRGDQT